MFVPQHVVYPFRSQESSTKRALVYHALITCNNKTHKRLHTHGMHTRKERKERTEGAQGGRGRVSCNANAVLTILVYNPFTPAVPFWGQITWNLTGWSPQRDCSPKKDEDPGQSQWHILAKKKTCSPYRNKILPQFRSFFEKPRRWLQKQAILPKQKKASWWKKSNQYKLIVAPQQCQYARERYSRAVVYIPRISLTTPKHKKRRHPSYVPTHEKKKERAGGAQGSRV